MVSLPCTGPCGSKRVKVKASTYSSSGTPYCRPSETAIAKLLRSDRSAAPSLCMSMKISPRRPSSYSGAQIDLVAADHRLLGVALAAVGHALPLADHRDALDHLLDDALGQAGRARRRRLLEE